MSAAPITLKIENLTVAYRYGQSWLDAVREVSLEIEAGQTYGLVGESGSGKTTLANAVMRYLGPGSLIRQGRVELDGRDLTALSTGEMRKLWGAEMGLVPQNPLSALNPSIRIGEQIAEILRFHLSLDPGNAHKRSLELLTRVRLPDVERVADSFPHQISGGMQQRVLIAMALSTSPHLLVLDEPTTNLDVTTQASILDLFRDLIRGSQTAVLYITHNLGVVAQICDRVAVLYAGELVEDASLADLFRLPLHPYTQGLLDSIPKLGENKQDVQLQTIRGQIPPLGLRPTGCVFEPRCPLAIEACKVRPPLFSAPGGHAARCVRWEEIAAGKISARLETSKRIAVSLEPAPVLQSADAELQDQTRGPVLDLKNVQVHFSQGRTLGDVLARRPGRTTRAVEDITFAVSAGETMGLVGESGSGKTSLARAIVGLVARSGGEIGLLGLPLPSGVSRRSRETLRHLQMVFQNPEEALNPYLTIGASLCRPLMVLLGKSRQEAEAEVKELLAAVRLPAEYAERMPSQLSGGEKQRIAILRAFAAHPDLLIADEPVSSLDVSVQASILNLLNQLQAEYQNALLFISHDLAVVGFLADRIAVVYLGHLMELARARDLFQPPYHPYTEALLSAVPSIRSGLPSKISPLEGDIPSPSDVPSGCPFHTRCPHSLGEICSQELPPWRTDPQTGKGYACHLTVDELRTRQHQIGQAS